MLGLLSLGLLSLVVVGPLAAQDEQPTIVPLETAAEVDSSHQRGLQIVSLLQGDEDELEAALELLAQDVDGTEPGDDIPQHAMRAAAGALYRSLAQRSTDEQYDLLHAWTMPTADRKTVRLFDSVVPRSAPPRGFAREIGERPRDTTFPIAEVNGVRGLFSTGWMLVTAADDIGRLRRLTSELEPLAAEGVPGAGTLLLLAQLAERRPDLDALTGTLNERIQQLEPAGDDTAEGASPHRMQNFVVAAAALRHEDLRPISEEMLDHLVERTPATESGRTRPLLRIAHATAIQLNRGESGPDVLYRNRLNHWVPASGPNAVQSAGGHEGGMWLVHEDHVLHLAGIGNDQLLFRYPLAGDFDFVCETQLGGAMGTDGGLTYGGLNFEALGRSNELTIKDADGRHRLTKPCPFMRHEELPTFNRVGIRVGDGEAAFLANLHPMWRDGEAALQSPWLGLRAYGTRRPVFRNPKLTGNPVIPREVNLTAGSELRGWEAFYPDETLPPFAGVAVGDAFEPDWQLTDGVLTATTSEPQEGVTSQSLLRYQRPLLDGETIRYEFFYEPDTTGVHPALGRMAFLIDKSGVRVHWVTSGNVEWTGLPEDNALLEPLNRRGPRQPPLKQNDWNEVTLARADGKVELSLNGEMIYQRPVDEDSNSTFGLYRDRTREAVRVRNVVMTGDWPETVPEDLLQTVDDDVAAADGDRRVRNAAVGEQTIAANVQAVRRDAAAMRAVDRYEYLSRWLLPGPDHAGFRLAGQFTQTDPSTLARRLDPVSHPTVYGGELVSPVFDLIEAAVAVGRLDDLVGRIAAAAVPDDEYQQRARAALEMMLRIEQGDLEAAGTAAARLHDLVEESSPRFTADMWPETLAVAHAAGKPVSPPEVGELLRFLFRMRDRREPVGREPQIYLLITSLHGQMEARAAGVEEVYPVSAAPEDWLPMQRGRDATRGKGLSHAWWGRSAEGTYDHLSGHDYDWLIYRYPVQGNWTLESDIRSQATTQVLAAGHYFGPRWKVGEFEIGQFRPGGKVEPIDEPINKVDEWCRLRINVDGGTRTIDLNGKRVWQDEVSIPYDPWIGIRSWRAAKAQVRAVQLVGEPTLPAKVALAWQKDLVGWMPYYGQGAGWNGADWSFDASAGDGGELRARHHPELAGSDYECLLYHQRPLTDGDRLEYEFFYRPGELMVHPALDRLAFLLGENGLRLHWLTDGKYDTTPVEPGNAVVPEGVEPGQSLPLQAGEWNHLAVALNDGHVLIELNGALILDRELEPTNRRAFGLFHFGDRTGGRIRNITLSGDWPTEHGTGDEQELAEPRLAMLDSRREELTSVFTHDFVLQGLPDQLFELQGENARNLIRWRFDGVHAQIQSSGELWKSCLIAPRFEIEGDFDFEATIDQLDVLSEGKKGVVALQARMEDAAQHEFRSMR
ncbi:MAG: DUF1583 domain-containing protein, partial [Maioricimonas sp. JB045]